MKKINYVKPELEVISVNHDELMADQTANISQGTIGMGDFEFGGIFSKENTNEGEEGEVDPWGN